MVGILGLRAVVLTFHQTSLLVAVLVALLSTLLLVLIGRMRQTPISYAARATCFVVVAAVAHATFSWMAGFEPLDVEVIRLERTPEDPPPRALHH